MKVETKLNKDLPKAPKSYRSVKGSTNAKHGKFLVRILDERCREGVMPGFGGYEIHEVKFVTQPTLTLGWYLPNNFEAEWNGLRVSFRVEQFTKGKQPRWGISSLTVEPLKEGKPIEVMERIPLQRFLEKAIHLSGVQMITYPPGYEGAMLGANGEVQEGWKVSVPTSLKEGECYPVSWLGETPREILLDFIASATSNQQRKQLTNKKRLELVAKAWKAAPERGKAQAVLEALVAAGDVVGLERVKQLIGDARKLGLIPQSTRSKK